MTPKWISTLVAASCVMTPLAQCFGQEEDVKTEKRMQVIVVNTDESQTTATGENSPVTIEEKDGKTVITFDSDMPRPVVIQQIMTKLGVGQPVMSGPPRFPMVTSPESSNVMLWGTPGELNVQGKVRITEQANPDAQPSYFIGVECTAVSEALKSQLGLMTGVLVKSVVEGKPADGKLEVNDILTGVGVASSDDSTDQEKMFVACEAPEVLAEQVRLAGEGKKMVAIEFLRSGKKMTVELQPAERKVVSLQVYSTDPWKPEGKSLRLLINGNEEMNISVDAKQKEAMATLENALKKSDSAQVFGMSSILKKPTPDQTEHLKKQLDELKVTQEQLAKKLELILKKLEEK